MDATAFDALCRFHVGEYVRPIWAQPVKDLDDSTLRFPREYQLWRVREVVVQRCYSAAQVWYELIAVAPGGVYSTGSALRLLEPELRAVEPAELAALGF